jgi:hypothetical protein
MATNGNFNDDGIRRPMLRMVTDNIDTTKQSAPMNFVVMACRREERIFFFYFFFLFLYYNYNMNNNNHD